MNSQNLKSIQTLTDFIDNKEVDEPNFILKGLLKAHIGMLIAAPDQGKSHLALSLAIEHCSNTKLIGLSITDKPSKTLLISAEDNQEIVKKRLSEKLNDLPTKVKNLVKSNLLISNSYNSVVASPDDSIQEKQEVNDYVNYLISAIKENDIDLVIVDTVSEIIGNCDEVKNDKQIKRAFQKIARESGAAILLIHHVNKMEIRGEAEINMASGAGLTSIMRLSKFIFTITKSKNDVRTLKFLKANYINQEDKKDIELNFSNSLLVCNEFNFNPVKPKKEVRTISQKEIKEMTQEKAPILIKSDIEEVDSKTSKRIRDAF